jgi:hypothetical protein
MPLCRHVYYSKYNLNPRRNVAEELKQILASAIRSNSENGLTGGLVFNRKFFAQVLEGEDVAVMQTLARIYKDRRHSDIAIAGKMVVSERLFGAWSMGYAGNTDLFKALCEEHGHVGEFDPTRMSGSALTTFILELVMKEANFVSSQKAAETLAGA